jgi:hypothetical protein
MVNSVVLVLVGFVIGWIVGNNWDEIVSKATKKREKEIENDAAK